MTELATSFRDPQGVCCRVGERVLRFMAGDGAADFETFLKTSVARDFAARRQLASTWRLAELDVATLRHARELQPLLCSNFSDAVFEHERIPFPSYPYEWPPEMLWEAGRLTLELARHALAEGYGLKDATPYNILYRGSDPVFIDLLSFESRAPGDPVWRPYAQFVRTFVLPLLCARRWGIPLAGILLAKRDGLEPQEVYRLCSPLERMRPPFLSLVSIPAWLSSKRSAKGKQLFRPRSLADPAKARFILESLLSRLGRRLESLKPPAHANSIWSGYMEVNSYDAQAFAAKEQFVESVLREFRPARVLDVGANTGHFSRCAAKAGAEVVAVDSDAACVGQIWQAARQTHANILPLVVDLARPSPPLGWRNGECASFLDRATGRFDCVLMLALIHHLLVTERIALEEVFKLASELTTSLLVVEFVGPEDSMFQQLTRGREELHAGLNVKSFEKICTLHFDIIRSLSLPGTTRKLYALKLKARIP